MCTGYIYSITHAYPHGSHNVWYAHASTLDWLSVYTHNFQVVLRVRVDYGKAITSVTQTLFVVFMYGTGREVQSLLLVG